MPSLRPIPAARLRRITCAACLTSLLALAAGGAPTAWGAGFEGSGAGSQLTEGGQETQTQSTTTTTPTETTNSKSTVLIAGVAAVLLLSGIAFVIVRDARRVAPAGGDEELLEQRSGHDAAVALRKRRAKAKAARKQRKRTRR